MSILIKGMEMPKEPGWVVTVKQNKEGRFFACNEESTSTDDEWHEIIPVPDHGRLIDADAVLRRYDYELSRTYTDDFAKGFQLGVKAAVGNGTAVVIEAEEKSGNSGELED